MKTIRMYMLVILAMFAISAVSTTYAYAPAGLTVQRAERVTNGIFGDCMADHASGDVYNTENGYCLVGQPVTQVPQENRSEGRSVSNTAIVVSTPTPQKTPDTSTKTPKVADPTATPAPPTQKPTDEPTSLPTIEPTAVSNGNGCTDLNSQGHPQCSNEHSNPSSGHTQNTVKTPKPTKTPKK